MSWGTGKQDEENARAAETGRLKGVAIRVKP
jgi:hypothetical protein